MKPIGDDFLLLRNWEQELAGSAKKFTLGFLIDSPTGEIKRSGLTVRPESVLDLDKILTDHSARVFYIDPLKYERDAYKNAVRSFDNFLRDGNFVNFQLSAPYLILMTKGDEGYSDICLLEYDTRLTCMWFSVTRDFLESYFANNNTQSKDPKFTRFIKHCAGTVRDESLKEVSSKLISVLSSALL